MQCHSILRTPKNFGTSHTPIRYFTHANSVLHTRQFGTSHTPIRYFTHAANQKVFNLPMVFAAFALLTLFNFRSLNVRTLP
jgi:hypothetical protein